MKHVNKHILNFYDFLLFIKTDVHFMHFEERLQDTFTPCLCEQMKHIQYLPEQ